ncbi:hypothetical protein JMN32_00135 [Fulvivirga sp. 29W222]|uniref:HNH nuclease domain-containing protein n=1 Tax=Fulvivirga marina TaxID=2494733 RepID=A0A937KC84_9BACT|nr:HNH endonuclease domain-containing protein [Fulvivirga marina]MBL6444695.1 hypothetical protein [Fulvivirga marina]
MHSLIIPDKKYSDVFNACISKEGRLVKSKFLKGFTKLNMVVNAYDDYMLAKKGHEIDGCKDDEFPPLSLVDLKWLYDRRLSRIAPGRNYYDEFLLRSKNKGCCFCSYGEPVELDHFLPKSRYAQFAIHPNNLVPVCSNCNRLKGAYWPKSGKENLIHPFFENYDTAVWLHTRLEYPGDTPVAIFYVKSDQLDVDSVTRIERHCIQIKLFERYTTQANRELNARCYKFKETYKQRGKKGLKEDILEEVESRERFHLNSWQSALYRCLAIDDRFLTANWEL